MANTPTDRLYSKDHEWAGIEGDLVRIGLTDHAQRQLGDVVFVELPSVGDRFESGEPFGSVESVKAVSEVYVPVTGEVAEVNPALNDSPELVNEDPYADGWMIRLRTDGPPNTDGLLSADEYAEYLKADSD
ncbi:MULTISPECIES: glycine cleavage system protein GcvH [Streptomyces]|uniref:Glycine cleavage system H protein n=1 Tax=Streptomyces eurythermus TaxID=42237 RepID=A0ABW6YQV0_9ACTN|nr:MULTISPECIES: glycine cleavage system protein GcvH [Streptomyces]QIS72244.1 glycine cleavage system protein GcvH [Streptomyces sp. DSM 40868]WDM14985.1 glycine cleavage system protein GcvH [Streptomyces lavenduligriseus]